MSSTAATQNFKAGIFVLSGAALTIALVFILSNAWSAMFGVRHVSYTVVFPVSNGVQFLAPGSDVRLGGLKVVRSLTIPDIVSVFLSIPDIVGNFFPSFALVQL